MITREEIRTGFATLETNEQKAEFCRQHMEQEQELPELYENLVNKDGEKLFNFKGLYEAWSSDSPKDYVSMKNYGMTMREYTMKKITKTSKDRTTEEMIEDVSVEVPNVKEDDVSRIVGEMNEV
jgi:hypothetical protein|tara:strand:- start:172 stop:543 length:372 start_codon:yes stop_codon:yes gene_type:complete